MFIGGIVAIIVFYLLILLVGIWAARKSRAHPGVGTETEDVMLAGRNIGLLVGIFTMTATWVGGGFINGTAEIVFTPGYGLVWCQAPIGYALSLVIGGLFFANRMRTLGYVTMLDPFQNKFGERMCGLLFIPALLGEVFWTAAILSALGSTLSVILGFGEVVSIITSTCIALVYTIFGGLYSVAYTDVVQLFCIFFGLWLSIPFAMTSSATTPITETWSRWSGTVDSMDWLYYMDNMLMLTFGGIPWQVYFQRVLSSKTPRGAQILSYIAALGCVIMAIPSVLIGAVGAGTNWNLTEYNSTLNGEITATQSKLILPLVLTYLTPPAVAFIGLGAVSAAVMSSSDSSVLSAASMFARNVAKPIFYPSATERQVIWVMRVAIFVIGAIACVLAIVIKTIYGLWYFCSDLVYVILFPQLICVLYVRFSNTYGSVTGYLVGLFLRLSAGEALLHLPPLFQYPYFYAGDGSSTPNFYQRFPCKTFSMLISFGITLIVSFVTDHLFRANRSRLKYDIFKCYKPATFGRGSIRNRYNRPSISLTKTHLCVRDSPEQSEAVKEGINNEIRDISNPSIAHSTSLKVNANKSDLV